MLRLRLRLRQEWDQWVGRCRKEGSPVQDEQPVQSCGDHNRRDAREALGQEGFWYCLGGLGLRLWEAQVGKWAREQQYGWSVMVSPLIKSTVDSVGEEVAQSSG